jgi:hypothetical protein
MNGVNFYINHVTKVIAIDKFEVTAAAMLPGINGVITYNFDIKIVPLAGPCYFERVAISLSSSHYVVKSQLRAPGDC